MRSLNCGEAGRPLRLDLTSGSAVRARAVVIASGVHYRRPDIPNLAAFEGNGVSYWASPIEAKLCEGEEIALVGAGNSAGQAVVYLAAKVRRLHLIVRGDGLEASMSRYLIERIASLPNVELHTRTEVVALLGDRGDGLSAATFRNRDTGAARTCPLKHLFLFIGADAHTGWLDGCVDLDDKGFVVTGAGPGVSPLETSKPGVFAIGDVRAGSTKRVAAAVGEGAAVVAQIHAGWRVDGPLLPSWLGSSWPPVAARAGGGDPDLPPGHDAIRPDGKERRGRHKQPSSPPPQATASGCSAMTLVSRFELVLFLLAVIVVLELAARRLRLPPAAAFVLGGVALALIPATPQFDLDPDLALVLFLPPLIMSSAYFTVWREFRDQSADHSATRGQRRGVHHAGCGRGGAPRDAVLAVGRVLRARRHRLAAGFGRRQGRAAAPAPAAPGGRAAGRRKPGQ